MQQEYRWRIRRSSFAIEDVEPVDFDRLVMDRHVMSGWRNLLFDSRLRNRLEGCGSQDGVHQGDSQQGTEVSV